MHANCGTRSHYSWLSSLRRCSDRLRNTGMFDLSYEARLRQLNLYSLQRRRDQYQIIYIWKIIESKVANLEPPIQTTRSSRLGRFCVKKTVPRGHAGTLMYNSFRWNAIRLFNTLPASIRNFSGIDISVFT